MSVRRFILAPDSFKGTLRAQEVCTILKEELSAAFPQAEIVSLPIADGGEGTVEAMQSALGGALRFCRVTGPEFSPCDAAYLLLSDGTAVAETASCAGLPMAVRKDPTCSTTYGVGELILRAARDGAKRLILGLGGSATHDGGCGAAAALGVRFSDGEKTFIPTGGTLERIAEIDCSGIPACVRQLKITCMCDVENPLTGPNGASCVFAPQKGADAQTVQLLERNLLAFAALGDRLHSGPLSAQAGVGAAGGLGYGMKLFFGAELKSGVETVLECAGFDRLLTDSAVVVTGEGKLDRQSFGGKVITGILRHCRSAGVPVWAVVGCADAEIVPSEVGLAGVVPTCEPGGDFAWVRAHAEENLRFAAGKLCELL